MFTSSELRSVDARVMPSHSSKSPVSVAPSKAAKTAKPVYSLRPKPQALQARPVKSVRVRVPAREDPLYADLSDADLDQELFLRLGMVGSQYTKESDAYDRLLEELNFAPINPTRLESYPSELSTDDVFVPFDWDKEGKLTGMHQGRYYQDLNAHGVCKVIKDRATRWASVDPSAFASPRLQGFWRYIKNNKTC